MVVNVSAGKPAPLGATRDESGVNFALFSAHAKAVELCLFDVTGRKQLESVFLPEFDGEVWHGYLTGLPDDVLYAYRVHGPWAPHDGHYFDPFKLVIDPYAKCLVGDYKHAGMQSKSRSVSQPVIDNVPKARIMSPVGAYSRPDRPQTAWQDTVIYEAHVRGHTKLHTDVPQAQRGTYAGLAHESVIGHLLDLGITAIELMPCHEFVSESFLLDQGLVNYWGYNTINFFTPHSAYQYSESVFEFADMVDRYHDAGIEVFLDVVYNHSAEGDHRGTAWSYRGIDNASYYRLVANDKQHYMNYSGCGNTLNLHHPRVLQLVMDSLRYWHTTMGVDGFRFDLATTLARGGEHYDRNGGFLSCIKQDPELRDVKLIAEPWDIGPDGYRTSQFPHGWAEWNDRYRDSVRRYWKQDVGQRPELARRLLASSDMFEHSGRKPWSSVNFICSHDGYTLADICSYEQRHNEANGEENRDGHSDNASRNWGVEGPTEDRKVQRLRDRHRRNMMATMLLSQGTPMLLAGDEFGRTQRGNNNAYCQDNELTWTDWSCKDSDREFFNFVKRLIKFRASHPILREVQFLHRDRVHWYTHKGRPMTADGWHNDSSLLVMLIDSQSNGVEQGSKTEIVKTPQPSSLLIAMNPSDQDESIKLPELSADHVWQLVLATEMKSQITVREITRVSALSFAVFESFKSS